MSARLDLVRRFYAAIASGDIATAEAMFDTERIVVREAESLPYGGTFRGIDGFRELMKRLVTAWKRVRFEDHAFAVGDDTVFARFTMVAVSRKTGAEVAFPVVEVFEFDGDRIVAIAPFCWDTHALRGPLGVD